MDDFEETLQNIDVFCKVLVQKMIDEEEKNNIIVEPMENLLQRKYVLEEHLESSPLSKNLIPLPQVEEPLIDVFEEDNYVKVLMQCRCKDQKVSIHPKIDGLEICKKECHTNAEGIEVCKDNCQKLDVPTSDLQIEDIMARCSNNAVFEVTIPKVKDTTNYST
jgi:hypothetical protein